MKTFSFPFRLICFALWLLPGMTAAQRRYPEQLCTQPNLKGTVIGLLNENHATHLLEDMRKRVDPYTLQEADYLSSRLYMNWSTRAANVYIKGETFSHLGNDSAVVPTVMFGGTRGHVTPFGRPSIDQRLPYADERQGVWMHNRSQEGSPLQWVALEKTGTQIPAGNCDILSVAKDAACLWWLTEDERYGRVAASVFDTFMTGLYHSGLPVDINHGHQQTLVGLTSFEVIHEDIVNQIVPCYDYLYDYLIRHYPDKIAIYDGAFKKLADVIIRNGVPHNNWNIIQARFVFDIAQILDTDKAYDDNKGREFYINTVLNDSTLRQWSLKTLAAYGFDPQTGIWNECPGYSLNVVNDYVQFALLFDKYGQADLQTELPVLTRAAMALPQYCFPNRKIVGFGDTHPHFLRSDIFLHFIRHAQQRGRTADEQRFTALYRCFSDHLPDGSVHISRTLEADSLRIDTTISPGRIESYVSPTFHAPAVSWLVQRNGMDPNNSLMYSLNGSEGNHQHANGISLELYGCGTVLAPDAGIGQSLYSGIDYAEYYSQFPAHNTVCVDGISSYPVMKSNHAFRLLHAYPSPSVAENRNLLSSDYARGVSYSEVYFREPESQADQRRLLAIIDTEEGHGYYVDIFRSRKAEGEDRMHDYFYHNLGQEMHINATDNTPLVFQPTEELSFAGAHLYAYSYLWDQQKTDGSRDTHTRFTIHPDNGSDDIHMDLWQQGAPDRTIFRALSPETEGLSRDNTMPYRIKGTPTLTFVARQQGEAWTHPFVSILEPSSTSPALIRQVSYFTPDSRADDAVGICVQTEQATDYIFSSAQQHVACSHRDMQVTAAFALLRYGAVHGEDRYFMGDGTHLVAPEVSITTRKPATVTLYRNAGQWYYTSTDDCRIVCNRKKHRLPATSVPTPL